MTRPANRIPRPRRARRVAALAVGPLLLVVSSGLAGCGDDSSKPASETTRRATTTTEPDTTTSSTTDPSSDGRAVVYLTASETIVGESPPQTRGTRTVVVPVLSETTGSGARAAVEALVAAPAVAGFGTAIPPGTTVASFDAQRGSAVVDLSPSFLTAGDPDAAGAQIVFTATRDPSVQAVTLRVGGERVTTLPGGTIDWSQPVGRDALEAYTPSILVEEPPAGATVASPLRVRGIARVFENTLTLQVLGADGAELVNETVTATGAPFDGGAPFTTTLLYDAPAGAALVLRSSYPGTASGVPEAVLDAPLTNG